MVLGGGVINCAVGAYLVEVVDVDAHDVADVLQGKRGSWADGVLLESTVEALEFAVGLWAVRGGEDLRSLPVAHELLEAARHKLTDAVQV